MDETVETGVIEGLDKDPSIQMIPTLGPTACTYNLLWAVWIRRAKP